MRPAFLARILPSAAFVGGSLCAVAGILSGCGGDGPAGSAAATDPKAPLAQADATTAGVGAAAEQPLVRVDADGRKWYGQVPVDVFFADPLAIAANAQPVAATSAAANGADAVPPVQTTVSPAVPAAPVKPGPATADWADAIAAELLDAEVKKIVNRLNEKLQTVGTYNSSHLELPPHIHTLAALSGVAAQHPGDIRWKDKAKFIRDLAGKMGEEKLQQGPKSHKALQEPFEQITVLMSGSEPGDLPDAPAQRPFSEVAEFGYLMKRLEIGSTWLKVNVGGDEALKSNKDDVLREASVVAAIGRIVVGEGYGYEDFEDFQGFANDLVEGSRQIVTAAQADNFAEYDKGINRVYKACQECHTAYR
ncbi:MAG: hypothetical protein WD069_19555 [Planctomycetales bacterium]